uniref:TPX2 C-terminal domain-containing protein n=1 Tax=Nelumbo nucifera TaxID=4432 RepID=A0A822YIG4_NELNU|nr:TPA_asm: hypothetical protein HUJ06_009930 [Nelumbo nucifera]
MNYMVESTMDALEGENGMEKPTSSKSVLEVSVSFGRFENDSLSWERWSSFSPNKYLEEVEKCSTPGSVAQKKAYFEAHYKKIAARRAQLLEEEKQMEADKLRLHEASNGDLVGNVHGHNAEFDPSNFERTTEATELESNSTSVSCITNIEEPNENNTVSGECQEPSDEEAIMDEPNKVARVPESNKDATVEVACQISLVEGMEELKTSESPKSNKREMVDLVKEDNRSPEFQSPMEVPQQPGNEKSNIQDKKVEDAKLKPPKESLKGTPVIKHKNLVRERKKPATPIQISPQISTPRVSKSASATTVTSASRTSARKASRSSLPKKQNPSTVESKRSTPTLHLSLSLEPTNSDSATHATTRRSFIMEKMGDKEIVKKAFKTFQNSLSQQRTSSEARPLAPQQVLVKGTERNMSASMNLRKEKQSTRKGVEKGRYQTDQVGPRQNFASAGALRAAGVSQTSAKSVPSSSFGLRSDERAEKQKEVKKEAEIKKLRQSLNFKATPMPDSYRTQGMSKTRIDKGSQNHKIRHGPESTGDTIS